VPDCRGARPLGGWTWPSGFAISCGPIQTDAVGEGLGLARLEELVDRAKAQLAQQRSGLVAARSATQQRAEIRHVLETKLLRYLVVVGVVAARENMELAAQFRLPSSVSHQAFLTAARGMLEKANAQKELLVKQGMSASLLDDLTLALGEFEKTLEASRAGRRAHVGASAELEAVAVQIVEQVRVLDGLVRYRFGDNAELMGAWASARNVLGPFRPKIEPEAGGGETPKAA
jgi:high-affinity Fe2+/Pb2+ permease